MSCAKCGKECLNVKEVIKCSECKSEFHATCSRIRTVLKLQQMNARAVATWRCDTCSTDSGSQNSQSDKEESAVLEALKNIQGEIQKSNNEHKESFTSLQKSVSDIHSIIGAFQNKMSEIEKDNKLLHNKCTKLDEENEKLHKQLRNLQEEMDSLQQYSRCHNVEIKGIPLTKNENVYDILGAVARVLGVNSTRSDVSIAHRLGQPRNRSQHPSIVVQFLSRSVRAEWLAAARRSRIKTTDLAPALTPGPVYINEHLTGLNKALLGRAKYYVTKRNLARAWCRDGKIFFKKTESSPPVRVWSLEEVDSAASEGVNSNRESDTDVSPPAPTSQ